MNLLKVNRSTDEPDASGAQWPTIKVGKALNLINGRAFKPTEWAKTGIPIVRIQNLNNPDAPFNYYQGELPAKFALDDGDLLFAWSGTPGTSFGAHIWRGGRAWLNQHIFKVEFDGAQFDKRFLQLAINQNLAEYIRAAHGGAGLAHITKGRFEASDILQPSLPEQRQIVAEIEKQFTRLDAGVAALQRAQANLKRYRAAVLTAACEGRLVRTEAELSNIGNQKSKFKAGENLLTRILAERRENRHCRGKYKEPAALSTDNLQPLPDGWTWTNLDSVIVSGPQNGVYLPRELYGRGYPILRIDDFQDGWVRRVDELNKVSADKAIADKYQLFTGDLVINRVNSLTHLGKCMVVQETQQRILFESNMMKAHLADCVIPRFVEYYLRSRGGKARLTHGAKWAVNQASINQEDVKQTPLPLPPIAEQMRIVAEVDRRLSVVEELEMMVSANLQRASRLRQSILQKAFTGRLNPEEAFT